MLRESIRRELVKSCEAGLATLDKLLAQRQTLEAEIAAQKKALAELTVGAASSARAQLLNSVSCVP